MRTILQTIDHQQTLDTRDLAVGSAIAVIMAATFIVIGGTPLIATFIPSLVVAWVTFLIMYLKRRPLPRGNVFVPLFLLALAWQFLHFNEEFATGFARLFPTLYGTAPFSDVKFLTINMVSYFLFAVTCVLVFTKGLRFLVVPVLFFVFAGALGNAVWHTWWVIWLGGYFPGFVTAQLYWFIGFVLLSVVFGSRRGALALILLLALLLVPALTYLSSPAGVVAVHQHLAAF